MSTPQIVLDGWVVVFHVNDELMRMASPRDRDETIELIEWVESKGGEIQVCMPTTAFLNVVVMGASEGRPLVRKPKREEAE